MPTNVFFSPKVRTEQHLYEDIVIEALRMYGQDVFYIPRDTVTPDEILNEEYSKYASAYVVEMYVANTEGFEGDGNLLSKFGLEIRDQATFVVARRRFQQLVEIDANSIREERPREGDLIYLPLSKSLFEIKFVEHEKPFYQLSNLPTYELQCELFEYSAEKFETGVKDVDRFERIFGPQNVIQITGGVYGFKHGDRIKQVITPLVESSASATSIISGGSVTDTTITVPGFGYDSIPSVTFAPPPSGVRATGTVVIANGSVVDINIDNPGSGYLTAPIITIASSGEDDAPELAVTGEVANFIETRAGVIGGVPRQGNLYVTDVKATDGSMRNFSTGGEIVDLTNVQNTDWVITKVYNIDDKDMYIPQEPLAQNEIFENKADDIIDFSESNPFGDPRTN